MRVWLINPHDAVPGEPWGYKHGMLLARTLASAGHDVTYWASNFSHATKQFRSEGWGEMREGDHVRILLVPMRGYKKHVGLSRLLSLVDYARNLWKRGKDEIAPDCIITTVPTTFSEIATVRLKRKHKAVLISDFRDLWPDLFLRVFPSWFAPVGKLLLWPLYAMRRYLLQNSDAVTAVCETYVNYAMEIAPGTRQRPKRVIYSSGVNLQQFQNLMSANGNAWLPAKADDEVWAVYAGTLGAAYDVPTLMEAARALAADPAAKNVRIMVAGDGPMREQLQEFSRSSNSNVLQYLGVLDMPRLCQLYAKSDIGLSIYAPGSTVAIPAKAFDYYAAELPLVNSVNGEFRRFLYEKDLGINYDSGDAASLANSIRALAADKSRREKMKLNLRSVAPRFDAARQYSQFLELLPQASREQ